jgi:excinuclease ABC subunit A
MLLGADTVLAAIEGEPERLYSRRLACVQCDISVPEVSPRAFSFNSVYGACPACEGLGRRWDVDPAKVIPDPALSLLEGAVHPWRRHGARLLRDALRAVARRHGFALETPVRDLRRKALQAVLHGDGAGFAGVLPHLRRRLESALRVAGEDGTETRGGGEAFEELRPYLTDAVCPECRGARLRRESLAVRVMGKSLADYVRLPVSEARAAFDALEFADRERPVADRLLQQIRDRVRFLERVGVGYLSLDRAAGSFSPLSFGTTHAANASLVNVAFGVELVAQELASATWKTYAAPVSKRTPGAPTSAVAPSAENTPMPSSSLATIAR